MNKSSFFLTIALAAPSVFAITPIGKQQLIKSQKSLSTFHNTFLLKDKNGNILESTNKSDEVTPKNWFNLDPLNDGTEGVSAEKVYKEFGAPKSKDIVVAVIDSGVDVNHEDLVGKIWMNEDEIPGNGIDDDNNGYIDDVFGWNFIGNEKGMAQIVSDTTNPNGLKLIQKNMELQVDGDTLEVTRELVRLEKLKAELAEIGEQLLPQEEILLAKVKKEVESSLTSANSGYNKYKKDYNTFTTAAQILKEAAGLEEITLETVLSVESDSPAVKKAKNDLVVLLQSNLSLARINSALSYYESQVKYYYNTKFDTRATIVKDDYSNQNEKVYGNNNVIGPDSFHGTHVAGIIAANRDNNIGIKGVASNVKIMAIRTIPNGDERDKDVANSIRYAVDNGAKIINMSFGKSYSPYKTVVDEAIKYAQDNDVLLVHAAGNSDQNNDTESNFPNRDLGNYVEMTTWLEIGASSFKKGESLAASFSNYGKKAVDFFAPGVDILSTTPGNGYGPASGTSMASPATAGVAALVLSYNPALSALELKDAMIGSLNRFPGLYIYKQDTGRVLFSELSIFGGTPNAYEAVKTVIK